MKTYLVEIRRGTGCMFITRIKKPKCYDPVEVRGNKMIYILDAKNMAEAGEKALRIYNAAEKYELVKELISPNLNGLFVTPKDIDETVKSISYTISEAINYLFASGHAHK